MRCLFILFSLSLQASPLPQLAIDALDHAYKGWTLAPMAAENVRWFKEYTPQWEPNRIDADFDGDGRRDWCVQILHQGRQKVVIVLDHGSQWAPIELTSDAPDPYTFLLLYAKGARDFDFTKLRAFRYATDSVGVMYFVKTPLTFYWRGGRFTKMLAPSDEDYETR